MDIKIEQQIRDAVSDALDTVWDDIKTQFKGHGVGLQTLTNEQHRAWFEMKVAEDLRAQEEGGILGWRGPNGEFAPSGWVAQLVYLENGKPELSRYEREVGVDIPT